MKDRLEVQGAKTVEMEDEERRAGISNLGSKFSFLV